MKDFPKDSGNLSDSSIYKARIREQDIAANQKLQEIQGAADEFARQAIINKLKQAEVEREKLKLEFEQEASGRVDDILSYVELRAEGDEGYFANNEMVLESFWQLFKPLFDYFKVDADFETYRVIKEREKQGWLAAIIKFLRDILDALKELIKKVFSADLSWDQSLDKEIKELEAKLNGGKLSEEEFARVYERLESLQLVKLRLQICLAGCAVIILARLFSAELKASVETTKEEGKEKASAKEKEATKEVHEIIEIKVDAKGRYQIVVPSCLLDFSSGVARPITLTKPERDLLSDSLRNLIRPVPKPAINNENREVKETKVEESKKAAKPKEATPSPAPRQEPAASTTRMEPDGHSYRYGSSWGRKKNSGYKETSNQLAQDSVPNGKAPEQSVKSSVADCEYDFTSMGTWGGAEHEPPTSEFNNIKITRGRSAGKTLQ